MLKEIFTYLTAYDAIKRESDLEDQILAKNIGNNPNEEPPMVLDADLETAVTIYLMRAGFMLKYPAILAARLSGIDFIVRKLS